MDGIQPAGELRWLFLDLNSFFASVEQNENPDLLGKPVAVLPLMTDSTCVIAASYAAKKFGIKTGTPVWQAKKLCPDLILLPGRHDVYVDYHNNILAEVDRHIPVSKICSIDEVACRLDPRERPVPAAVDLAMRIKAGLRANIGPAITCSIGLGPNRFLGKVGSDMQKPDGLVVLEPHRLPGPLLELKLTDLCGIAKATAARLERGGITSVAAFWQADPKLVRRLWGGIQGERFWYELHGCDLPDTKRERGSLSHSQVLAPEARPFAEARLVARRLTQKIGARLRRYEYKGRRFGLFLRGVQGGTWAAELPLLDPTDENFLLLTAFERLWRQAEMEVGRPSLRKVGIWLSELCPASAVQPTLFDWATPRAPKKSDRISGVMDQLNRKFGKDTVLLGMNAKALASYTGTKIAFDRIPDREEFYE